MTDKTTEERAAFEALDKAIKAYRAATHPNDYVDQWILLTRDIYIDEDQQEAESMHSSTSETSSAFVRLGMLTGAVNIESNGWRDR